MASDLYTTFTGISPTSDEILNAETLVTQVLTKKFTDLDTRQGTAVRDLVIRPFATLLAMLRKAQAYHENLDYLSTVTNSTDEDVVDRLMSNWFVDRNDGEYAVLNARLYFTKALTFILPSSAYFSPDNTLKYYPSSTTTIQKSAMSYDPDSDEYYVDVDLKAESTGTDYNVSSGSLLFFSTFNAYFLRGEINYLSQEAADAETNLEFVARAKTAVSTRNLINVPSIAAALTSEFNTISDITTVGHGDDQMIRDSVQVVSSTSSSTVELHMGGKVDIYCRGSLTEVEEEIVTDSLGVATLSGFAMNPTCATSFTISSAGHMSVSGTVTYTGSGYAKVTLKSRVRLYPGRAVYLSATGLTHSIYSVTNNKEFVIVCPTGYSSMTNLVTTVTYTNPELDEGFSDRQLVYMDFGTSKANSTFTVSYDTISAIQSIQTYLEGDDAKVVCADQLARSYDIYKLNVAVVSHGSTVPDQAICTTAVKSYLDSLAPGESFIMGDMLAALFTAGITSIKTPVTVTYSLYTRDLMSAQTGTITDVLKPYDNTSIFMLDTVTTSL